MSEMPRPVRARRLTASVVPGRGTAGYGKLVATRLRRIATERRTGQLPFAGSNGSQVLRATAEVYIVCRVAS